MAEYTALQIVEFLKAGDGPDSLFGSGDGAQQMATKHEEARDIMTRLQSAMAEAWEGDAAGQAQAGAGPLLVASEVSASHLKAAQGSLGGQGGGFADLKNKVGDGPGPQPDDDFLSRNLPVFTGKDEEIEAWNAKAQQVVEHYSTYADQSSGHTTGFPQDYGDLTLPAGGADVEHAPPPVAPPPPGPRPGEPKTAAKHPVEPKAKGPAGGHGPGEPAPPGGPGPQPGQPAPVPGHAPGQDDTTQTSGVVPVTAGPNPVTPAPPSFGLPNISGGTSGGFGPDGGYGNIGARLAPGFPGEEGGGSGARGGPGGPGARTGAGQVGQAGSAGRGVAGAAGKPGAQGLGGGAQGRGGKKEEDKEHKRPEYLLEPDADELFGGYPDGMKPVPPTIGT